MNQRSQNIVVLGVLGSLALVLGGQVHQDPCSKEGIAGDSSKYFGPTCSETCLETDHWWRRKTSDVCRPGNSLKTCSTIKDPLSPYSYTVWKYGECSAGECTLEDAQYHSGPVWYDLFLFSSKENCDEYW